eukprot:8795706-Lingulodinium_polyedra.AAC.1
MGPLRRCGSGRPCARSSTGRAPTSPGAFLDQQFGTSFAMEVGTSLALEGASARQFVGAMGRRL